MKDEKFYATATADGDGISIGNKFLIIRFDGNDWVGYGRGFYLLIDGEKLYCLENQCSHLYGGDWRITKEKYKP